jgi:ABC-type lipoprotein export system ATPase subunit/ABC-type antimicrobial peptide transport system permease subunit
MDGVATAVDVPDDSSGTKKRRRRRARREAAALPAPPGDHGNGSGNGAETISPPTMAEAQVVSVAVIPELESPVNQAILVESPVNQAILVESPAAEPDDFKDLLGQAVGLRLDSVSREFGGSDEMHVSALRNVSLEIGPCEFVSVVGPSGCGKTTLLSLMGGLDRPTSGHVYGAGLPLGELSEQDLADYRLQRVSTIFQTFNLIPSMTVEDNVALPLTLAGVELEERRRRARHLLALVGLENRARTRARLLSGGEQQKVAVARALANRPGLILADEPTGSLDSAAGEGVLNLLEDLNRRGATVVLVTHDPEVARRAHRVVRMIDGRAIELGPGNPTVRKQEPLDPPPRLHWRDTLKVGLGSAGRRPLRTTLTTTGVAIGIAAMSLIVALAGGLQGALNAPALATSQVHQVEVYPAADAGTAAFDAGTLATLAAQPHVSAAWGQLSMSGSFATGTHAGSAAASPPPSQSGALVSLAPLRSSSVMPLLSAGRLPSSDAASEVLLTDSEASALGFLSPGGAIGTQIVYTAASGALMVPGVTRNPVKNPLDLKLIVVGIVSGNAMPAGAPGGMAPYATERDYWAQLARTNSWKGEYSTITLLADSGLAVGSLQQRVEALGFQAQTFGDQFRSFEDLLGKMRVALLGLALVALLLACLGIANTMYTAVLERTKEIGVLKALGARRRDVLLIFVAEAAFIGLAGGLVGILIAVGLGRLGNAAVDRLTQSVAGTGSDVFRTDFAVVAAGLVVAVVLSTVSGLLPALRAAVQDPARALRYE